MGCGSSSAGAVHEPRNASEITPVASYTPEAPSVTMQYRNLGNSGLKVSVIGWGNAANYDPATFDRDFEIVKYLVDNGVNFFDTAEMYADGKAEIQLGKILKKLGRPREDLVITTKIFKIGEGVNSKGTLRKHLMEGVTNSLKRLQLDYVDVVYAHRFDHETSIEEVCRAMHNIINKGKAFYWGTSEWSAAQIKEAYAVCDKFKLIKPITEQPQYNMLTREKLEVEYAELFDSFKMGTTIWSPLAMGYLTGKYNNGIPRGSRFADPKNQGFHMAGGYDKLFNDETKDKTMRTLNQIESLAKELNCTMAQLALAWAIRNKDVSTAIIGATNVNQVKDSIKALDVLPKLTDDVEERIGRALNNTPQTAINFKTWQPFAPRR